MVSKSQNLDEFVGSDNSIPVKEFVEKIKTQLTASSAVWWRVALLLGEAEAQYGFSSKKMKELISEINFSASKANKLIQVSKSDRLKENLSKLATVSAWTVYYKLTTLSKTDFDKVLASVKDDTVVSIAWIDDVLGRTRKLPSNFKSLFSIEVNIDAVRAQDFDGYEFEKVEEALEALKNAVPNLEVKASGIFEREQDKIAKDLDKAGNKALRKIVREAVANYKRSSKSWQEFRNPKLKRIHKLTQPMIEGYDTEQEIIDIVLSGDVEMRSEVWDNLSADWVNEQKIFEETMVEFEKIRTRRIDLATRPKKTPKTDG